MEKGHRMIRVVQDLTRDELDQLKLSYLSIMENDTEFPELLLELEDIPDEVLFRYYDGVTFAEEDFSDN